MYVRVCAHVTQRLKTARREQGIADVNEYCDASSGGACVATHERAGV